MEKNNFESLAENRVLFMNRLAFDDQLAQCMLNKDEYFKNTTVTELEKAELMQTQIYPFPQTMGKITETKSYITMKFDYRKMPNSGGIYKVSNVTFYAFCHEDLITTKYMILRYDYMLQCIDRLMNASRGEGWIGKMEFDTVKDVVMDQAGKYVGISVSYKNTEFQ